MCLFDKVVTLNYTLIIEMGMNYCFKKINPYVHSVFFACN